MRTYLRFATSLSILVFAFSPPGAAAEPSGPTAEEIVSASIDATGGAALDAVKAVKREGTMHLDSSVFGVLDGTWEVAFILGKKGYQIADFGVAATATGWNGTTSWENSAMGLRDLAPEELALNRTGWEINVLHALKREGMADGLERLDDASIDGRPHYVLELTGEDGAQLLQIYVDAKSSLISRFATTMNIPQMGSAAVTIDWADYADFDGIKLPQVISQTIEGLWVTKTTYTGTEIDPELADDIFEKPGS